MGSVAALSAVGLTTAYFYHRIGQMETEMAEIRKHLATLITMYDPKNQVNMQQVVTAIKTLDSRVAQNQKEIQTVRTRIETGEKEREKDSELSSSYQRLTHPMEAPPRYTSSRSSMKQETRTPMKEEYHRKTDKGRSRYQDVSTSSEEDISEDEEESKDYEDEEDISEEEGSNMSDDLEEAIAAMQ